MLDGAGVHQQLATGEEVVTFASNDYLGLSWHPQVRAAAIEAIGRWGTGSGASRLVVGTRPIHAELEAELARWRGTEAAVLFPTGYAANTGLLAALAGRGVTICSDELNHASIIDGCRLAGERGARVEVYDHGDLEQLDALLRSADGPTVVATDTVFSMDGDEADVDGLIELCGRHHSLLVLDEAHAVLGPGLPEAEPDIPIVRVGTLSKALGALGGFVAGPRQVTELLVNTARPYIFTTAPTPADTAAALAALDIVRSPAGDDLRRRLRENIDVLRAGHPSPILAVVVGAEDDALRASAALLDRGLLVTAIRPPTVAEGTSRLRVTVSAAHEPAEVRRLRASLDEFGLAADVAAPARRDPARRSRSGGQSSHDPARSARSARPGRLAVIVGTRTEVGKTWAAASLARSLQAGGTSVSVRKIAQSFLPGEGPTDAEVLGASTGEHPDDVCRTSYPVPMAPPMAAEALELEPPTLATLLGLLTWPEDVTVGLVESAGGVASPQAVDGDAVDLIVALEADVVLLVADAGLGTINDVRLCLGALARARRSEHPTVIVLANRFDPDEELHRRNVAWLRDATDAPVVTAIDDPLLLAAVTG